jgi:hypothetical protein
VQMLRRDAGTPYGYLRLTTWMAGTSQAMTASIDSIILLRRLTAILKVRNFEIFRIRESAKV